MCFWLGLEILGLVYKKAFFEIYAPYKSWKKFLQNGRTGYQKKRNFATISKCAEVSSLSKGKNFFTEKLNF